MFAVVDYQQQAPRLQVLEDDLKRRFVGRDGEPERQNDLVRDEGRIANGSEIDEPNAVARAVKKFRGDLERGASLSNATRTDQRQQSRRADELGDLGDLLFAPDERGERKREVVGQ